MGFGTETKLTAYLREREKALRELTGEIALLRSARVPLKVTRYPNGKHSFFSPNYALAERFDIRKRKEVLDHANSIGPDGGGYTRERVDFYPQFYFYLKGKGLVIPVYVPRIDFDSDSKTDSRAVVRSVITDTRTMGTIEPVPVDLKKALEFFAGEGVRAPLLRKLEKWVQNANSGLKV